MTTILILFCLFLVGVPIAFSLGIVTLGGVAAAGFPLQAAVQRMFNGIDSFPLIAVLMFTLAGALMLRGGISRRIVNFADTTDTTAFPGQSIL